MKGVIGRRRTRALAAAMLALAALLSSCSSGSSASQPSGGGSTPTESHFANVMSVALDLSGTPGTINAFWAKNLPVWWPGYKYHPPTRIVRYHDGQVPHTACGRADNVVAHWSDNAAYCKLDDSIAYNAD